ncbi:probable polyol transporter 4 isoform X2 [Ananas comosus]|uniref:Probable polyol transporter 4 isoform X2 n=1 Tax=Ananas comosus TaxID=4615 RepID=A0A6P5EKW6_ANACO|nr:probable polyol transporter 4 isoform X2 [Ananas comosus]
MRLLDNNTEAIGRGNVKYRRIEAEEGGGGDVEEEEAFGWRWSGRNDSRKYVYACATFASLNSVLLGYDVGVMSGAILFIQKDLRITELQEELLIGCLSIVSLLGSLLGGRTSDTVGRKWTIGLASIVFQCGAAVMAFAPSFLVLMIGRLLAGVGIGFGVMIAPVYIAEISPSVSREHINWRIMLGVGILPSVFIGFALFVIPESPRWLVTKRRVKEARSVLRRISESELEAEERLVEIEQAAAAASASAKKHEEKAIWRELLSPSPSLLRMLVAGCGIQCFQQITGIDATVYYSPTIFRDAGIESENEILAATVAVGFTKTAFILVAIFLIDKAGRKPLLYVGTVGMTVCLFVLGIALTHQHGSGLLSPDVGIRLAIWAVCGNVAFFSIGIGPICWVLTSEIFPSRLRAQASALGAVGNRLSSGLVAMSFLSVSRQISVAGTFFIFSAVSALSIAFVHKFVPETKGKSLEQIEMLFQSAAEMRGGEVQLGDVEHLVQEE